MPEQLLSVAEAAELLGVSRMTVYRLIRDGDLQRVKVRGASRIPESSLGSYLRTIGANGAPEGDSND